MSATSPRVPPVAIDAMTPEQKELVGSWTNLKFSMTIVQHPELYKVLFPLIAKTIAGSELPPRDRQILVIRTLSQCHETYELAHHILISHTAGLTDAELDAVRAGAPSLAPFEKTLITAADELVRDTCISDTTWKALGERYSQVQQMEVVGVVGTYTIMAMLTKSFGVQLEDAETFRRFQELRNYK